ncbi:MAG: peptidoglycan editing factor PgeF [Alphaproteobacteria bacterium]|nr:peptidoglycan editing factor PgeF [Alphaproteobacteria bacterium]
MMRPKPITHSGLDRSLHTGRLAHGFFTRQGGVSNGIHQGLNCGYGSDDARNTVAQNRARVAQALAVEAQALLTVHQFHSAEVVLAEQAWAHDKAPRGDAMVCTSPGIALGILTADCAPVLFADASGGVIGAAHAGWRGALTGVLEATVQMMVDQGARRGGIVAVVGPCIAQASYEVGPEFLAEFTARDPAFASFFAPSRKAHHHQFDLAGFVMARLGDLGLGQSHDVALDTYADDSLFYSYRRACHRDEGDYGRQIAAITLLTD